MWFTIAWKVLIQNPLINTNFDILEFELCNMKHDLAGGFIKMSRYYQLRKVSLPQWWWWQGWLKLGQGPWLTYKATWFDIICPSFFLRFFLYINLAGYFLSAWPLTHCWIFPGLFSVGAEETGPIPAFRSPLPKCPTVHLSAVHCSSVYAQGNVHCWYNTLGAACCKKTRK